MGFSMGGAIAQELALGHPDLVRSLVLNGTYSHPDPYFRQMVVSWMTTAQHASSERELLEAFFLWIYSRRAHCGRDGRGADRRRRSRARSRRRPRASTRKRRRASPGPARRSASARSPRRPW